MLRNYLYSGAAILKTNCKQDQGVVKFIEIKPLVLTHARQGQVTKIAAKQLLLWSHKTQCKQDQGVKNLAKLSPWFQYTLDRVR